MAKPKVLVVDDDAILSSTLGKILTMNGFEVSVALNVPEALKLITSDKFDVLLSDLHMPGAGDGLTVVSAMRHANPNAVTLLLSAFPEMNAAAQAILLQADEILVKPMNVEILLDVIRQRMAIGPQHSREVESVAAILERSVTTTIDDWFAQVETEAKLTMLPMSREMRCAHLPQMFRDLVARLQSSAALGTNELRSVAAAEHGVLRRQQGYSAAMMVEESRRLQVSIFRTLQRNLPNIDFSLVLVGVMEIADEVDSQLSQSMESYLAESLVDALPA